MKNTNEKINCRHCNTRIGSKHSKPRKDYSFSVSYILVPTKNGKIKKTKIRGMSRYEKYGNMESTSSFILETQFFCNRCSKHTTIKTQQEI